MAIIRRRKKPPIPAPMPAFAAVERPLWFDVGVEVEVLLSPAAAVGRMRAVVETAAPTVEGEGFAFAFIRIASVG